MWKDFLAFYCIRFKIVFFLNVQSHSYENSALKYFCTSWVILCVYASFTIPNTNRIVNFCCFFVLFLFCLYGCSWQKKKFEIWMKIQKNYDVIILFSTIQINTWITSDVVFFLFLFSLLPHKRINHFSLLIFSFLG